MLPSDSSCCVIKEIADKNPSHPPLKNFAENFKIMHLCCWRLRLAEHGIVQNCHFGYREQQHAYETQGHWGVEQVL